MLNINKYEYFFFDNFGTLWNGKEFYEGVLEILEKLVNMNKKIIILSNTTQLSDEAEISNAKKGLIKGKHYHFFITSGEFTKYQLKNKNIKFNNKLEIKKIYVYCKAATIFNGLDYILVDNYLDADFIYCGVPVFNEEKANQFILQNNKNKSFLKKEVKGNCYNCLSDELYLEDLMNFKNHKIPMLIANPDLCAPETAMNDNGEIEVIHPIRQGKIGELYSAIGGETLFYGKPYKEIYEFAFNEILHLQTNVETKSKSIMIGDNLNTDIKGAINFNIDSLLVIQNNGISKQKDLDLNLFKPTYLINNISNILD